MARATLTANLTIYIDSNTGNDSTGDGSSTLPFATLQRGHDYAQQNFDLANQFTVMYQCTGNFTNGVTEYGALIGQLDAANEVYNFPTGSVVVAGGSNVAFQAINGAMFTINQQSGLTIESPSASGVGVAATAGGVIVVNPLITFSNCGFCSVQTSWGGTIYLNGIYATGNSQAFAFASGGVIQFNPGCTNYFVGSPHPTYSIACLWAYAGGVIGVTGQTFAGSATGYGIKAELNGMVSCGGTGTALPPGTYPVQLITGGQYN